MSEEAVSDDDQEYALLRREVNRAYETWGRIDRSQNLAELSGADAADVALVLVVQRWMDFAEAVRDPERRKNKCGWCWRAAGATSEAWTALPEMTPDDAAEHALTCEHNQLVVELAGVRAEMRTVRRQRDLAEHFSETFRNLTEVHLESMHHMRAAIEQTDHENTVLVEQWWLLAVALQNYESNHGARCEAAQERYATIAESACVELADVRALADGCPDGVERGVLEAIAARIGTFLTLPGHEVPGLRARVAARDRSLDACANRIGELVGQVAAEQDVALQQTSAILGLIETLQDVRDELRRVGSLPEASAVQVPITAIVMRVDAAIGKPRFGFQARVLAAIDGGHDDDEGVS